MEWTGAAGCSPQMTALGKNTVPGSSVCQFGRQTQIHRDNAVSRTAVSETFGDLEQQTSIFLSFLELQSSSTLLVLLVSSL